MKIMLRYAAYTLGSGTLIGILILREIHFPGTLALQVFRDSADALGTSEYSIVEMLQLVLLLAGGVICAMVARYHRGQRPLAVLFGATSLACLIRELDYFLDVFLRDNLWQVLLAILLALTGAYVMRQRRRLRIALARIWPSPAIAMLFCGALVIMVFSNLIGHEAFWQTLLRDDYRRLAKLAMEEMTELFGYTFWFAGAIEYALEVRRLDGQESPVSLATRLARMRRQREPATRNSDPG